MLSKIYPYIGGRPKLTTKVRGGNKRSRYLEFLVDSGADYTMIWQGDALTLGIEYNKITGEEYKAEVANFDLLHTKEVQVEISINDQFVKIPALITKEPLDPLLGRKGVFDRFDILFQESKEQVTFIEH